jgi:hypothetical protein
MSTGQSGLTMGETANGRSFQDRPLPRRRIGDVTRRTPPLPRHRESSLRTPTPGARKGGPAEAVEEGDLEVTDYQLNEIRRLAGLFVGQLDESELALFELAIKNGRAVRAYEGGAGLMGLAKVRYIPQ